MVDQVVPRAELAATLGRAAAACCASRIRAGPPPTCRAGSRRPADRGRGRRRMTTPSRPASDRVLTRLMRLHPKKIDLTLGRVERLLAALGNPQDRLPPVIHVAGTNGKGSTVATMRACSKPAGYRVARLHLAASRALPRAHPPRRRTDRRGRAARGAGRVRARQWRRADHVFRDHDRRGVSRLRADAGRLSCCSKPGSAAGSTRPMSSPSGGHRDHADLARSSGVSRRHDRGDRRREGRHPEARRARRDRTAARRGRRRDRSPRRRDRRAALSLAPGMALRPSPARRAAGSPLPHCGRGCPRLAEAGEGAAGMRYEGEHWRLDLPLPSLPGAHQIANAGIALACLERLDGFSLPETALAAGLRHIDWPARMQRLTPRPARRDPAARMGIVARRRPQSRRRAGAGGGGVGMARPAALSRRRHAQHQGRERVSRAARTRMRGRCTR